MLVLTFQIGGDRLALDIRSAREVVPRVRLHQPACSPTWLAGVFVCRGQVVPVIDLHRVLGTGPCPPHLSSRIILVPYQRAGAEQLVGLLAAHVADIQEVPQPSRSGLDLTSPGQAGLGPVLADSRGFLRVLDLDRLLDDTITQPLTEILRELPP
jgi:chemotaxis-related protein WspB